MKLLKFNFHASFPFPPAACFHYMPRIAIAGFSLRWHIRYLYLYRANAALLGLMNVPSPPPCVDDIGFQSKSPFFNLRGESFRFSLPESYFYDFIQFIHLADIDFTAAHLQRRNDVDSPLRISNRLDDYIDAANGISDWLYVMIARMMNRPMPRRPPPQQYCQAPTIIKHYFAQCNRLTIFAMLIIYALRVCDALRRASGFDFFSKMIYAMEYCGIGLTESHRSRRKYAT